MDLGTVLVVVALVLAVVALFIERTPASHRLLAGAIVLLAIGVLVGAAGLNTR